MAEADFRKKLTNSQQINLDQYIALQASGKMPVFDFVGELSLLIW